MRLGVGVEIWDAVGSGGGATHLGTEAEGHSVVQAQGEPIMEKQFQTISWFSIVTVPAELPALTCNVRGAWR